MDFFDVSQRIDKYNTLDFGDILSKSIELFKKVWLQGFLMLLMNFVFIIPVIIVSYVPLMTVMMNEVQYNDYEYIETSVNPFAQIAALFWFFLILFGGIMVMSFLMYAMLAGFFRVLKKADLYNEVNTNDLFYYFKGKYLSKTALLGICASAISLIALMLCFFPLIYVAVPINMMVVVFAFNPELSVSDIVKLSFKIGNKYWFLIFGLTFVGGMIANIGMFACGIGILFTASFARIPLYFVYKDAVGFEESAEPKPLERF